jgi:hypothetical protein
MDRLCWWCCHPWDGEVLHLPYKIEPKTKLYLTMGQFCSWSCMRAYNMDTNGLHKGSSINSLIIVLHKKMTGNFKLIKQAPHRHALTTFGGTMSIEEFRNLDKNIKIEICYPNQVQRSHVVTQQAKLSFTEITENEATQKMNNINNTHLENETLKLKRSKPLKRDVNNLEKMMGITRTKRKL